MENLIDLLQEYSDISGYKSNQQKSEILGINIHPELQTILGLQFWAKWKDRGIRYLGIKISKNIVNMVKDNIEDLATNLLQQLRRWVKLRLTWFGRVSVIKMNVLLWILIYFLDMPVAPKQVLISFSL